MPAAATRATSHGLRIDKVPGGGPVRLATTLIMKIAICNETFRDWPHDEAFQLASELGYDGIELAPFTLAASAFDISPRTCRKIRQLAAQYRLQVVGLHWLLAGTDRLHLTSPDPAVRFETARYLRQLARICFQTGGQILVFGSPEQRNRLPGVTLPQAHRLAAACIQQVIPELQKTGVTLALEPLGPEEGDFLRTARETRDLIQRIDSPAVQLHLDVKAMSTETDSIPEIIRASRRNLVHFHCNDPNRRGPGMGLVDYAPIIAALREVHYAGWLSVEVFDTGVSPPELARQSIDYLREQLG